MHDRRGARAALHMERFGKRAHRTLSVAANRQLFVTELVAVEPPEPLATFLAERRYLPRGIPMLKHVLALPGQTVCREAAHRSRSTSIAVGKRAQA